MDDTRFDIDAHDLFQFGNADVVVVQGLDMVDLGFVEAQLGIEDVQVDADAGLVTDILDTIVFTGLVDDGLRFFDLLGGTARVFCSVSRATRRSCLAWLTLAFVAPPS